MGSSTINPDSIHHHSSAICPASGSEDSRNNSVLKRTSSADHQTGSNHNIVTGTTSGSGGVNNNHSLLCRTRSEDVASSSNEVHRMNTVETIFLNKGLQNSS